MVHDDCCMDHSDFELIQGQPPFDMADAADHLEALGKGTVERGPLLEVKRQGWCVCEWNLNST